MIDDVEMEIGDQQVGGDMQKVPDIPHPQVHILVVTVQTPVLLGGIGRKIVVVDTEGILGPHFEAGNRQDARAGPQIKYSLGDEIPEEFVEKGQTSSGCGMIAGTKGHTRVDAQIDSPLYRRVLPGRMDGDSSHIEDVEGCARFPIFMPDDQLRPERDRQFFEKVFLLFLKKQEGIAGFFPKPDIVLINQGGNFIPYISFEFIYINPVVHWPGGIQVWEAGKREGKSGLLNFELNVFHQVPGGVLNLYLPVPF